MNKKLIFIVMILSTMIFISCKSKTTSNLYDKLTNYTYEDIKAKAIEGKTIDSDTMDETGLKAYSIMLSYLDQHAGPDAYYIYDAFFVEMTNSHVIRVVLKDYYHEFLAINDDLISNGSATALNECIIILSYDTELSSGYEPFLMARKWFSELQSEFETTYSSYYVNSFYIQLDHISPYPSIESYGEDRTDWRHFYTEESTYKKHLYSNRINIYFPLGTTKEEMHQQISSMASFFYQYSVTAVNGYILTTNDALDKIKAEELMTGNSYMYNDILNTVDYIGEISEFKITKD